MPPPAFETCDLCGKKFSKASLGIHMRACVAKREASTSFCPVCDNIVSNDEYEKHVAECKVVNAAMLKKKKAEAAAKAKAATAAGAHTHAHTHTGGEAGTAGAAAAPAPRSKIPEHILRRMAEANEPPEARLLRRLGQPCDACGASMAVCACVGCHTVYCVPCSDGVHAANAALADHKPVVREDLAKAAAAAAAAGPIDSRMPCNVCKRRFAADRIAKHQLICTKLSTKKPRKKFISAEDARLRGTEFEGFKKFRADAPEPPSRWREEHAQIQAVAQANAAESAGAAVVPGRADAPQTVSSAVGAAAPDISSPPTAPDAPPAVGTRETASPVPAEKPKPKKPAMRMGDKVVVIDRGLVGVLQFKGPVWGMKKGTWYGVEFHDGPHGNTDGSYDTVHYFYCPENHGVFTRPENLRLYVEGETVVPGGPPPAAPQETTPAPAPRETASAVASVPSASAAASQPAAAADDAIIEIHVGGRRAGAAASAATATASATKQTAAADAARPASAKRESNEVPTAVPATIKPASSAAASISRPPSAGVVSTAASVPSLAQLTSSTRPPSASLSSRDRPPSATQMPVRADASVRPISASSSAVKAAEPQATGAVVVRPASSGRTIVVGGASHASAPTSARSTGTTHVTTARPAVETRTASRGAPASTPSPSTPTAPMPGGRPLSGSGARAARPLSATRRPPSTGPAQRTSGAGTTTTSARAAAPTAAGTRAGASATASTAKPAAVAARPAAPTASTKMTSTQAKPAAAPAPSTARTTRADKPTTAASAPAKAAAPRGASAGPAVARTGAARPTAKPVAVDPMKAAREAALKRQQEAEASRPAAAPVSARAAPTDADIAQSARAGAPSLTHSASATAEPVGTARTTAPIRPPTAEAPLGTRAQTSVERPPSAGSARPVATHSTALSSAPAAPEPLIAPSATTPAVAAPAAPAPTAAATAPAAPAADPESASMSENHGAERSLVARLRHRVEQERAGPPVSSTGPKSTRQKLAELAAAEGNAPPPARKPTTTISERPAAATLSSDMDARTRDIMRNVDYLRVLAGDKSKLAAEDAPEKPAYIPFSGTAHKVDPAATSSTSGADTNPTGEKRRIIVGGQLQIAKGLSDTPAEMAKRAAALRARLGGAGGEPGGADA